MIRIVLIIVLFAYSGFNLGRTYEDYLFGKAQEKRVQMVNDFLNKLNERAVK